MYKFIEKVEWDSKFFNLNIYRTFLKKINIEQMAKINNIQKNICIDLLYHFQDPIYIKNSQLLELNKFYLVQQKMELILDLFNYENNISDIENESINVFDDYKYNIEDLYKISKQISVNSRFYNDKHFSKSKVEELYKLWVYNSYYRKFADRIYIYNKDENIYGFCIVQIENNNIIRISLIGVDQTRERKGIGSIILKKVLIDYKEKGYKKCSVATQANNVNALNFYIKHNFKIYKPELVFHKWFRRRRE
jgi:ribosomal protein S18 acetylase RimI-like enzyme